MFDDPRDNLKWLEDALLEEEEREVPLEEEDEEELDLEALLEERPTVRPRKRRTAAQNMDRGIYEDEAADESAMVPDNEPRPKGIGGLVVLALLELTGIVAVALWWVKWAL